MRQIDADALKESVRKKFKALSDRCEINELINAAPTIDAVQVVHCRDCMYYNTTGYGAGLGWCDGAVVSTGVWDDFYCADGERKWHKWQRWQKEDK